MSGHNTSTKRFDFVIKTDKQVYVIETNNEVPNNSNPSKKQILLQAVKDLNGEVESNITLYQLQHRLEKLLNK